jgi:hypothetical protein
MALFAEVDAEGVVLRVIVADQSFINTALLGNPSSWLLCDFSGKKSASKGYTWDATKQDFRPPKTFKGWVLNETLMVWDPPHPNPREDWVWDEDTETWRPRQPPGQGNPR